MGIKVLDNAYIFERISTMKQFMTTIISYRVKRKTMKYVFTVHLTDTK